MSKAAINIIFYLFLLIGCAIAFRLSSLAQLESFKLLNAIGVFYDITGLIILSELLSTNRKFCSFVVDYLSKIFVIAHFTIPLGAVACAGFLMQDENLIQGDFPSAATTGTFAMTLMVWMMIPMFAIESVISRPLIRKISSAESRNRILGSFILLTGLVMQFMGAIQDIGIA